MATLFGRRGGACCSVADNIVTGEAFQAGAGQRTAVDVALEGIAILGRMDRARARLGIDEWLPSLSTNDEVGLEDAAPNAPELKR
jgi:uridine phosphorylase